MKYQNESINDNKYKRSIGAAEAMWRLLGYHISERYSAVNAPRVHLPIQANGIFSRENCNNIVILLTLLIKAATSARPNRHTQIFHSKILNNS